MHGIFKESRAQWYSFIYLSVFKLEDKEANGKKLSYTICTIKTSSAVQNFETKYFWYLCWLLYNLPCGRSKIVAT